ncbi:protease complex subunit PrcB family protein [Kaarinaea lacus]
MLTLLIVLSACFAEPAIQDENDPSQSAKSTKLAKLETLRMSSQCGSSIATQWISHPQQLEKLLQAAQGMMISASPAAIPEIDFSRYGVLLLSMGQQRTGGYAIRLAREEMRITGAEAEVSVQWQEPEPGMMVTQVITHPCIFIKMPLGEYQQIRAVDQQQKVRAEITIN